MNQIQEVNAGMVGWEENTFTESAPCGSFLFQNRVTFGGSGRPKKNLTEDTPNLVQFCF